ncbi:putative baseplate assembly protein [Streptomyces chartreusis]|uniref:putative baseplate assembly protein n=1 Tax=Streptomyces chartreusis TaxID=1969 RepID=UPI0033C11579
MALPAPNLDDRRFQDLVYEAKELVMRRCPEWTDHNVSDPGVTLIEAFATMTDHLLYRLNQLPDRLYVKFLDLIGLRILPPVPARVNVTFWSTAPIMDSPLVIRAGTEISTLRTETEEAIGFTTDRDLEIFPVRLIHVLSALESQEEPLSHPYTPQSGFRGSFAAFADRPAAGDALVLGLDQAAPNCAVRVDFDGRVDGVGVDPDDPPLAWEAYNGQDWVSCAVSADETGGLNKAGHIMLHVPASHQIALLGERHGGWLRARVRSPQNGRPGYTSSPIVYALDAYTVGGTSPASHLETVGTEVLGRAEGVPGQRFKVSRTPVLGRHGDPVLEVENTRSNEDVDEDNWQTWTRVTDFSRSGPEDRHFLLDAVAGEVILGPAVRDTDGTLQQYGAVPKPDAHVRIRDYATGGGAHGNVPAGAIRTLKSSVPFIAAVENREAASGGADGESAEEAMVRGPLMLRSNSRAVTAEDFEVITREAAPELSRVRCVAAADSGLEGGVRVLIVPDTPPGQRVQLEDLVPSQHTLDRVAERLDETRLLGTRVVVEPPLFRGVTVVTRISARQHAAADRVRQHAEEALYRFLNPLPPGGPHSTGWPFGRPVQIGEIFALLQRVDGVDLVDDVRLFAANPVTGERGQETRRIELEPNSLVVSFDHHVRVEEHR